MIAQLISSILIALTLAAAPQGRSPRPHRASVSGAGRHAATGLEAATATAHAARRSRARTTAPASPPAPPGAHGKGAWYSAFTLTEYWPVPESWFSGRLVTAPGIPGRHHVDWLYSAAGVEMEGDGVDSAGRPDHLVAKGAGHWVDANGRRWGARGAGPPIWYGGGWRTRHGTVTFPLAAGGWSAGPGVRYTPQTGAQFAPGASLPLTPWHSLAVDTACIPRGSKIYIPAYSAHGGWFIAQDTGSAIIGRHLDIYRPPPPSPDIGGQMLSSQSVYVVAPVGERLQMNSRRCRTSASAPPR